MASAKNDPLQIPDPAIPKGSIVAVTGVNGFIGSHVADQLLAAGYKVRGVVRDAEKTKWLLDLFATYGEGSFELKEAKDMAPEGALDDALKGA
ncbi:MAG: GDP-mannose 4,6-dehydratase [Terriglobus roseus]|nr:GDP-mannose 4,6-dehydratase [Terriglobus roseus]